MGDRILLLIPPCTTILILMHQTIPAKTINVRIQIFKIIYANIVRWYQNFTQKHILV